MTVNARRFFQNMFEFLSENLVWGVIIINFICIWINIFLCLLIFLNRLSSNVWLSSFCFLIKITPSKVVNSLRRKKLKTDSEFNFLKINMNRAATSEKCVIRKCHHRNKGYVYSTQLDVDETLLRIKYCVWIHKA